jgi:hypothetical protein
MPFPQRDLNLVTISPEVRDALRALLGNAETHRAFEGKK